MRMNPEDAAWYRLDQQNNTTDIVALLRFRGALDADRIRDLIARRFPRFPQLIRRVEEGRGADLPRWAGAEHFDVERHIEGMRLETGTQEELQELVGRILSEDLPADRPLWRIVLVENVEGGWALIAKIHHCVGDGFALVGLLLSLTEEGASLRERLASRWKPGVAWGAALTDELRTLWEDPSERRRLLRDLGRGAVRAGRMADALSWLVTLPDDSRTSLRARLRGERRAAWSRAIPLDRFKLVSRGASATVNDVLVASLAGALRAWMLEQGDRVHRARVRAMVPINLRPLEEMGEALGNRFGLLVVELPVDLPDPLARLRQVQQTMRVHKKGALPMASGVALWLMGLLPRPIEQVFGRLITRKVSLVVTNVPGPGEPLSLAGHPIEEIMFWVPHASHVGLGISLFSYAGTVRIGVRADTGVTETPGDFVRCFEEELERLEAALYA